MLVRQLPEHIKEMALRNQELQGNTRNEEMPIGNNAHSGNFNWELSEEGDDYWEEIYDGNYNAIPGQNEYDDDNLIK